MKEKSVANMGIFIVSFSILGVFQSVPAGNEVTYDPEIGIARMPVVTVGGNKHYVEMQHLSGMDFGENAP